MDVYILPKHIWGKLSADERDKYPGEDGVGSGPFVLDKFEKGQFARFKANKYYWAGKPAVDTVVIRKFNNPDAMVAALKTGELDAAWDIPGAAFNQLKNDDDFETNEGYQGSFSEVAINGGDGLKKPHPALADIEVRKAIAHAIDKKTLVARVLDGIGKPLETISPSANPEWVPELSADEVYDFDLDEAKQILEDAGYKDTDGDGVREMPNGGEPLKFTLLRPLRRRDRPEGRRVRPRLAGRDRDRHHREDRERQRAHADHRQGRLRHVRVGLDALRGPGHDARLHDLQAGRGRPGGPDQLLQRRELLRPGVRQALPAAEGGARPREAARDRARDADPLAAVGHLQRPLGGAGDDRLPQGPVHGWTQQPAKTGPVLFSNTSPTYAKLKPVSASAGGDDDGGGSGGVIAIIVIALLALAGAAFVLMRRRSADERE